MDVPEALQQWLTQMQIIRQQLDGLLVDDAVPDEAREPLHVMRESAERYMQLSHEAAESGFHRTDFNLNIFGHELRGALNLLIGYPRLFIMDTFGVLSGQQRQIFESIEDSTRAIAHDMQQVFNKTSNDNH